MIRTALRLNDAGQALFRMLAELGPKAFETATLLTQFEFDITRAALQYGLGRGCRGCRLVDGHESLRGCNGCVAAMRQRVHRLQARVAGLMGGSAPVTRHRRPAVLYGADRGGEDEVRVYDRAAASSDAEGAEGLEL